ncbi:MAG: SPOR domain-containing protein [Sphingopyxis sp.]|nr:SPOR domain-containing protein [Sphingopyxis sp.]
MTMMTRSAFFRIAASGLALAIGIGAPTAIVYAGDGTSARANPERAARVAERANEAMERGRAERALRFAEEAVTLAPADAGYRTLLGQAYLANGRFTSAEASFDAARELGAVDSRTVVGHALSLIASGRATEALELVDANAATLPASDFGLALALAGQPERGALVLTDVVRAGESTARDRQNLALAYALAGRWLEARLIAGQDLGPALVGERMEQWAGLVQSSNPAMRVAGLIGATVRQDPGMPVRLALRESAPVQMAAAEPVDPAPVAMYAPPPPADGAALVDELLADAAASTLPSVMADAPAEVAAAPAPEPAAVPTGVVQTASAEGELVFVSNPVIQPLRSAVAMVAPLASPSAAPAAEQVAPVRPVRTAGRVAGRAEAAPAATAEQRPAATRAAATGPVRTSGWAVQLGAYDSVGVARDGWNRASRAFGGELTGLDAITTSATVNGRTVYRLAVTGFDSRAEAAAACAALSRRGGSCFVRNIAAGEPVRWASRPVSTRIASR